MNRSIRRYEPQDLESAVAAWESASAVGHPFLTPEFLATERKNMAEVYLPNAETWVIEQDGRVIGFLSLVDNEIGGLFVDAAYHGTGAGRALMEKAKALHDVLELEVFEANTIGRNFYAKCGFMPISQHPHEETGNLLLRLRFTRPED